MTTKKLERWLRRLREDDGYCGVCGGQNSVRDIGIEGCIELIEEVLGARMAPGLLSRHVGT